jgi:hypothetical protein
MTGSQCQCKCQLWFQWLFQGHSASNPFFTRSVATPEPHLNLNNQLVTNMGSKLNLGPVICVMNAILFWFKASSWRLFWISTCCSTIEWVRTLSKNRLLETDLARAVSFFGVVSAGILLACSQVKEKANRQTSCFFTVACSMSCRATATATTTTTTTNTLTTVATGKQD